MNGRRLWVASTIVAVAVGACAPALAGAARTRPGGGGGAGGSAHASSPGRASGSPSGTPSHPSSGSRQHASGVPSYGYGGGYAGYPGYPAYPWYPGYYDPWWGYGWGWGYPYFSLGVWWPPVSYYGGVTYVETDTDRQAPAFVETDVRPKKAAVLLDGENVGRAKDYNGSWDRLMVNGGPHVLEFAAPGYKTLRVRLDAKPGRVYRVQRDLQEGEGEDPRSAPEAPAPPLASTAPAPAPFDGGAPALARGFLKIDVAPPDAAVYLDGEFLGSGRELASLHGAIAVAEGEHRVDVMHPSFQTKSVRVQVGGNDTARVDVTLEGGPAQ